MPFKHSYTHLKIKKEDDGRVKLSDEQKEQIRKLYKLGSYSQRELAREFNVSRRLIVFVIYPERLEKNYQKRVERGGSKQYYNKEKHTESIRKHRQKKQELYLDGKLLSNI